MRVKQSERGCNQSSISNRRSTHGGVIERNAYAEMDCHARTITVIGTRIRKKNVAVLLFSILNARRIAFLFYCFCNRLVSYLRVIILLKESVHGGAPSFRAHVSSVKKKKVRSAYSATPTWLTDPSPGNRLRPTARGRALQECPCRARLRYSYSGTSNGSTRPLCQEPIRCCELAKPVQAWWNHHSQASQGGVWSVQV